MATNKPISHSFPVVIHFGTAFCVAAGAVAAAGSAGLKYMGVNNEALSFVAGCALFGGSLLTIGVCFIAWGFGIQSRRFNAAIAELNARCSAFESSNTHDRELARIVRLHEDAEIRRDLEVRIKDVIAHFEEIQNRDRRQIEVHDAEIRGLGESRTPSNSPVSHRLSGEPS